MSLVSRSTLCFLIYVRIVLLMTHDSITDKGIQLGQQILQPPRNLNQRFHETGVDGIIDLF